MDSGGDTCARYVSEDQCAWPLADYDDYAVDGVSAKEACGDSCPGLCTATSIMTKADCSGVGEVFYSTAIFVDHADTPFDCSNVVSDLDISGGHGGCCHLDAPHYILYGKTRMEYNDGHLNDRPPMARATG